MPSTQRYWREIPQRYRLEAAKCTQCGQVFFPPRLACNQCKNREFESVTLPDQGRIATYTVIRTPPSEFKDLSPYALGLIELEGGPRIMCQITDCDPESLAIDQKVRIEFRKIQEDGKAGVLCYGYKAVPV
jgi:uncharacterized OB-fold protein